MFKLFKKKFVPKIFVQNNFWSEKICYKMNFGFKKVLVKVFLSPKNVGFKKIWLKEILSKNIWVQINIGSKKFWVKKNFGSKKFGSNKVLVQNKTNNWHL